MATGIVLAMQYQPDAALAFDSVERIMRDVNYGWLLRYLHMNGASFFFLVVYIHIFRGIYYGSYKRPRELLWWLGLVILLLMMATAFMGYVLPWGQMSFWGATVITNLFSAIPFAGKVVGGVASRSAGAGRPVLCVAGRVTDEGGRGAAARGLDVVSLSERFGEERAMARPLELVAEVVAAWLGDTFA